MKLFGFLFLLVCGLTCVSCKFFPKDPNPGQVLELGPMPAGFKICLIGDSGTATEGQYQVAKALENEKCDQIRILGDVIYPSGLTSVDDPQFQSKFYEPYKNLIEANIPFYLNMGNHDYKLNPSVWIELAQKYEAIKFPSLYYLEKYNDICFFNLETNAYFFKQNKWIDNQKEKLNDSCRIALAFGHHPRYSAGQHGEAIFAVRMFLDKAVVGKFDAYFAGHDHNLSDEGVKNGTHMFVSGSGAKLRPLKYEPGVWAASKLGYQTLVYHTSEKRAGYFTFYFHGLNEDGSTEILHRGEVQTQGLR